MKLNRLVVALVPLLLISLQARADGLFNVTMGHHTWAADGLPQIGPGEQASVFFCLSDINLPTGGSKDIVGGPYCSLVKCLAAYGIKSPDVRADLIVDSKISEQSRKNTVVFGKCQYRGDIGYDPIRPRHYIAMVGPKGDNENILFESYGQPTRAAAFKEMVKAGFPVDKGTLVIDYWPEQDWIRNKIK